MPESGYGDIATALEDIDARIDSGVGDVSALLADVASRAKNITAAPFSALGDGVADDRAAIQAAVDALPADGGVIFAPAPPAHYKVNGSIQLRSRVTVAGPGRHGVLGVAEDRLFVGNGVATVFVTGTYPGGDGALNRDIAFTGISVRNNGAPCIDLFTANNFTIDNCALDSYSLAAADSGTVRIRYAYRGSIRNSVIGCSGGGWAIEARDNANGLVVDHVVCTGGALGGAVNVGQSQAIRVVNNIIESSLYGIRVGKDMGQCAAPCIENNYLESVGEPISVGDGWRCRGGSISDNFISNGSTSLTPPWGIKLGRCLGMRVEGNSIQPKSAEPIFWLVYNAGAVGTTPNIEGCSLLRNVVDGGAGPRYDISTFPSSASMGTVAGRNTIDTVNDGSQPPTGYREWTSRVVTANVGMGHTTISLDTTWGGWVDGVDIIDASGTLACVVNIGTSTSFNEITSFDPAALTYLDGAATVDLNVQWRAGARMRAQVALGAGTGTFRIRVRWHGR